METNAAAVSAVTAAAPAAAERPCLDAMVKKEKIQEEGGKVLYLICEIERVLQE